MISSLDFPQSRRQEIISYLYDKYDGNVCAVGTLMRSRPKAALKDICRVLHVPFEDSQKMSSIIEQIDAFDEDDEEAEILTLDEIIREKGGELLPWVNKYPEVFKHLGKFIGMIRQSGSHASGVLISSEPFDGLLPLRLRKKDGITVSQFENSEVQNHPDVSWLGFIKFDLLGLRHLDTLSVARDLVKKRHGVEIDYYGFDETHYEDPAIYEAIGRGETLGIFQLETPAAAKICRNFKPESERDLAALVAADRPGVIKAGMLDHYINRRNGIEMPSSPHPIMAEILSETYEICLYQEDVIAMVQRLAGFSLDEADDVRKIMGKKLMEKMLSKKSEFIERCLKHPEFIDKSNGRNARAIAERCWDAIEPSAGYSFGKGHAHGYALIAAWECWMKHYYPAEFLTALAATDPEKAPEYLREAKKIGIPILPPDINDSGQNFTLTDDGIRYGITSVRDVGDTAYAAIESLRPFSSLEDLVTRIPARGFSTRVAHNLIAIGGLDRFGDRRDVLREFYALRKVKNPEIPNFNDKKVLSQ